MQEQSETGSSSNAGRLNKSPGIYSPKTAAVTAMATIRGRH